MCSGGANPTPCSYTVQLTIWREKIKLGLNPNWSILSVFRTICSHCEPTDYITNKSILTGAPAYMSRCVCGGAGCTCSVMKVCTSSPSVRKSLQLRPESTHNDPTFLWLCSSTCNHTQSVIVTRTSISVMCQNSLLKTAVCSIAAGHYCIAEGLEF